MAQRKEVFQSKVLQKLYPAASKLEKETSPPGIVDGFSKKACVKRKPLQQDTARGTSQSAAKPGRRLYTVLSPPVDYKDSEKSTSLPQIDSINSAEDPAEESINDCNEELDPDEEEEEQTRKRRRRKKKPTLHQDSGKDGAAPVSESGSGQSQTPVDEGGDRISKNKKRKLKKKRHKEKLLSLGLVPRATALEFTYRKDEDEDEDEGEDQGGAAEVSDFLRTTLDIYMSDSSLDKDKLPFPSGAVKDLLSSIANGCKPTSVLKQLCRLKAFVQQQDTEKLQKALEELNNTSPMSAEETTAVVSLFQYWITDIFPMQGDEETRLSTAHP